MTFEGQVQFGIPGRNGSIAKAVSVSMGQMASNNVGQAPSQAVKVPKSQLSQMDHQTKADDHRTPAGQINPGSMLKPEDVSSEEEIKQRDEQKRNPSSKDKEGIKAGGQDAALAPPPPPPPAGPRNHGPNMDVCPPAKCKGGNSNVIIKVRRQ